MRLWGEGAYDRGPIDGAATTYRSLNKVEEGDIVVNKIWARNGSVGVVDHRTAGCYGSAEFPIFAPRRDRLEPRWFHWYTKMPALWTQCEEQSRGTSGKNRMNPLRFVEVTIPLPSLSEQRRIVGRVEALASRLLEARRLRREATEEVGAALAAARDGVYSGAAARFGTKPLIEACLTVTDGDHQTPSFGDSGVRFIFVGNVSTGRLHFNGSKLVDADYYAGLGDSRKPRRGDVLYSAVGATLGVPAVVDTDENFCFQRHVAIIRPDPSRLSAKFLWHVLGSWTIERLAWDSATGSAQPTVPLRAIKSFPTPQPPLDWQLEAAAYLDSLRSRIEEMSLRQSEAEAEIAALLPSVLRQAFAGEL